MFSENQKISGRQAFRLLTYDLLGLSTLLIPPALARTAGRDGIFCIVLGIFAALVYLKLIGAVARDMNGSYTEYLNQALGAFLGKLVQAGYLLYFILLAGYTAYLFTDIVLKNLLREETFSLVLVLLLLISGYGLWGGIEGRARVYELLFWVIMIPLFLMLFSALNEVQTDYWTPVFNSDAAGIWRGSYAVFTCMAVISLVLFLGSYVKRKDILMRAGKTAVLFTGGVHAALYLILLGIFGSRALAAMEFPAITLMSTVKISGGFLKRADAFMFGIWFFTLYALLNSAVFYGAALFRALFLKRTGHGAERGKERGTVIFILALVFAVAGIFYRSSEACRDYSLFLRYVGTPFLVLIPLILALRLFFTGKGARSHSNRNQRKKMPQKTGNAGKMLAAAVVMLGAGMLSGCNTAELEDRNFPIEIAVDDTADFGAEWLNTGSSGNRLIDYSHLKVIILGQKFLEDPSAMEEFLNLLEEESDLPRNTYVVAAEQAGDIAKLGEGTGESIGSYLEELLENVSEVDKKAYPTLGMLYQEKENRLETLFIPFVSEKEKKPVIDSYYVWKRGKPAGKAESKTALLSFFTANEMQEYTAIPADGVYVRLFEPHNEISFSNEGGRKIVVDISCSGESLYGDWQSKKSGDELEREISDDMNRTAQKALREQRIDTAGSFKKLGGYERAWFGEYEGDDGGYEADMQIEYRVHITWVNR